MITAGIDIGSATTKVVLMKDERILSYSIVPTGVNGREAAEKSFKNALVKAGIEMSDVKGVVATGYGRIRAPFTDKRVTEITCHARGVLHELRNAGTVIDIGGQDSKVISIGSSGRVVDFVMNDRCAAGTGRFLEVTAHALGINVSEMGGLALKSSNPLRISSMCTVFAESEVISLLAQGESKEDIIAGLHESISERISSMLNQISIQKEVVLTGGVAKNAGIIKSLERKLKMKIIVPAEPQISGAVGAALIAQE